MRVEREVRKTGSSIAVVGLVAIGIWLVYCAIQPHNFWSGGSGNPARTIFGWDAPGISATDQVPPDRIWIVLIGWPLLSVVAGWYLPKRWLSIGIATVLPTWIIYIPTAPRDIDGLWGVGVIVLPFAAAGFAFIAWLAGNVPRLLGLRNSGHRNDVAPETNLGRSSPRNSC